MEEVVLVVAPGELRVYLMVASGAALGRRPC